MGVGEFAFEHEYEGSYLERCVQSGAINTGSFETSAMPVIRSLSTEEWDITVKMKVGLKRHFTKGDVLNKVCFVS